MGAALAVEYAEAGRTIGLIARNKRRLDDVAACCANTGARCLTGSIDVTDQVALERWIDAFDAEHPIDLLFVNAGVYTGHGAGGQMETIEEVLGLIRTNLEGAAITIGAVLPGMRRRRRGRIVLIGSLAALQCLPDAPGYSASKAGLVVYGEALREYLACEGISVSIVCPGYIKTAQTAHHVGALPLQMTPQRAAAIIRRRVDRGRSFIAFPLRLYMLIRLGRLVDWRIRAFLGRGFRFYTEKPLLSHTEARATKPAGPMLTSLADELDPKRDDQCCSEAMASPGQGRRSK
ncbi:MAG: SDR family NAD(P)-dependent oxidoreductase [Hyphomicrobiaceae bacterium]|nr:SDR family NAD(P)-dependent oxidoreductase [Hyphomicrobiaceae bacterium]